MNLSLGFGLDKRMARNATLLNQNEPEVATYITGLSTPLSSGQITNLNTLVKALKTGLSITNLSDVFDTLYLLAGETAESSLRNLVKNAHHATAVNAPTFTAFEGFVGNGSSSYIDTAYNPVEHAVNYKLNDSAYGIYSRSDINSASIDMGARTSSIEKASFVLLRSSNFMISKINQNETDGLSIQNVNSTGLYIINRSLSNLFTVFKNKNIIGSSNNISTYLPTVNFYILAANTNNAASVYSQKQISFAFTSKSLTQSNINSITDAFEAYMDAKGKGVIA